MAHDVGSDGVIQGATFAALAVGYHCDETDIHLVGALEDLLCRFAMCRAIKLYRDARVGQFNAVVAEKVPAPGRLGDLVTLRVIMKQNDLGIEALGEVQYTGEDGG